MKRYFLFTYDRYYPGGGMTDYCGAFATVEEAKEAGVRDGEYADIAFLGEDGLRVLLDGIRRGDEFAWTERK